MAVEGQVGTPIKLKVTIFDQHGVAMTVTPDSPPSWGLSDGSLGSNTPSADGMKDTFDPTAVGTESVTVSLAIKGTQFSANLTIPIAAEPQVPTSIAIEQDTP